MKDRLCRMSRKWAGALCLLVTCGLTYSSCSDDYDLPDKKPDWLGPSIYDYLSTKKDDSGKLMYTNFVRLIDSLDYKDVLARTGSKTLFVADDEAFARFYANNPWGVTRFEDLTVNQRKLLLNNAMLDNAYLLEMLTNISASNGVTKNMCLRQVSSVAVTDSIAYIPYNSPDVPYTHSSEDADNWFNFRIPDHNGRLYLATDATAPMMTHFINGQMSENNITDQDFEVFAGQKRESSDVFIYGNKILEQDITCLNGYVNRLENVLVTPSNMAEVIRTNGKTNIVSHMLDRFSVPIYDAALTRSYSSIYGLGENDSVFVKRYFSSRSAGESTLNTTPYGAVFNSLLNYDPGWNQYNSPGSEKEVDMAAMFVPSDEALKKYFLPEGNGEYLINTYGIKPNTEFNLEENIDQIPLSVMRELLNNMMKGSFNSSVPSKYITIMNDARDPMFSGVEGGVQGFIDMIDTCLLANNGAVYVLNGVVVPAAYASVASPTLADPDLSIAKWIIHADDDAATSPGNAKVGAFFNAYLLAMSSRFSFFIPSNKAFENYYDPVSFGNTFNLSPNTQARVFRFTPGVRDGDEPTCQAFSWNPATGELGSRGQTVSQNVRRNRMKDILDAHIVVHENADELEKGVLSGNDFYLSKAGSAVKVSNFRIENGEPVDSAGFYVQGGWQLDSTDAYCEVKEVYDRRSTPANGNYGNGMSYVIDRLIQPTVKSVYTILRDNDSEDNPYAEFFDLCDGLSETMVRDAGFLDTITVTTDQNNELNKYLMFTAAGGNTIGQLVRFYNAYRYTVLVPTNDAMQQAFNNGLPTIEQINQVLTEGQAAVDAAEGDDAEQERIYKEYTQKAQAMIIAVSNFLKYHFVDSSVFADRGVLQASELETACLNTETNRYVKVTFSRPGGSYALNVRDNVGNERAVCGRINVMARDVDLSAGVTSTSAEISASSYSVVHQLNGYLNFLDLSDAPNGRFDYAWNSGNSATITQFINKYRIKN